MTIAPPTAPTAPIMVEDRFTIAERLTDPHAFVGIDRISTWAYASEYLTDPTVWDHVTVGQGDGTSIRLKETIEVGDGVEVRIGFKEHDVRAIVHVDLNPSSGRPLVGLPETLELLDEAWDHVRTNLGVPCAHADIRVSRIDLTQDFCPVKDMQTVLGIASRVKVPYRPTETRATNGALETVYIGKARTRGYLTVYDKSAEAGLSDPTLRVEVRLRPEDLKAHGIDRIGALTEEALGIAYRATVEPLAISLPNKASSGLGRESASPRLVREAIGSLVLQEHGHAPECSRKKQAQHRRILNELGIRTTADIEQALLDR